MEDIKHTKKCNKCQVEKELVEFSAHPATKDGKQSQCKSCAKAYILANKDRLRARADKYYKDNKEKLLKYNKEKQLEYYKKNKEKKLEYRKKYYKQNKEKQLEYQKKHYKENKEKKSEYAKKHYKENKEHYAEYAKKYQTERYHSDPDFKLSCLVRQFCCRVTNAVKEDKELRSLEYLGCSIAEFKAHIESQWQEGMTWENHSKDGWHIDHIKPLDWFIKNSDDPWQANHYTNLQPLWAKENLSKNNKF